MSDEMTSMQPGTQAEGGKKKGFFSTTAGKWVAIVGGLGVVGILLGVALALIFSFAGSKPDGTAQNQAPQSGAKGSTTATETVTPKSPAAVLANADVFTFRDIFEPLIDEPVTSTETSSTGDATTGSTETSDSVTPMEPGVLYLNNILGYNDGSSKGLFYYNNQRYELGPGEGIPGTPWEVLRISSTGVVTMLYGDIQVTLTVGQGIRK